MPLDVTKDGSSKDSAELPPPTTTSTATTSTTALPMVKVKAQVKQSNDKKDESITINEIVDAIGIPSVSESVSVADEGCGRKAKSDSNNTSIKGKAEPSIVASSSQPLAKFSDEAALTTTTTTAINTTTTAAAAAAAAVGTSSPTALSSGDAIPTTHHNQQPTKLPIVETKCVNRDTDRKKVASIHRQKPSPLNSASSVQTTPITDAPAVPSASSSAQKIKASKATNDLAAVDKSKLDHSKPSSKEERASNTPTKQLLAPQPETRQTSLLDTTKPRHPMKAVVTNDAQLQIDRPPSSQNITPSVPTILSKVVESVGGKNSSNIHDPQSLATTSLTERIDHHGSSAMHLSGSMLESKNVPVKPSKTVLTTATNDKRPLGQSAISKETYAVGKQQVDMDCTGASTNRTVVLKAVADHSNSDSKTQDILPDNDLMEIDKPTTNDVSADSGTKRIGDDSYTGINKPEKLLLSSTSKAQSREEHTAKAIKLLPMPVMHEVTDVEEWIRRETERNLQLAWQAQRRLAQACMDRPAITNGKRPKFS